MAERKYKKAAKVRFDKFKPDPKQLKEMKKIFKKCGKYKSPPKGKVATAVAKRTVGKAVGSTLPGVGAALIARDVVKALSPSVCRSRGGKWVSGKCVEKKRKVKTKNRPVKDPISKR